MWIKPTAAQARSVVSQLHRKGRGDCVLVSSQCGGQVACHSLLVSLHSPLLAELLEEGDSPWGLPLGEGGQVQGLTLPLTLPAIQGLVKLLEGGDWSTAPVKELVKEAAELLGIHLEGLEGDHALNIGKLFPLQTRNETDIKMEPEEEVESTEEFNHKEIKMELVDSTEKCKAIELEAIKGLHVNTELQAASPLRRPKRTVTSPSPVKSGDKKTCMWKLGDGQICGKVFTNISNLTVHMRMHQDIRPFPCAFCDQTFRQKAHLQRHEARHGIEATNGRKRSLFGGMEEGVGAVDGGWMEGELMTEASCEVEFDPVIEVVESLSDHRGHELM